MGVMAVAGCDEEEVFVAEPTALVDIEAGVFVVPGATPQLTLSNSSGCARLPDDTIATLAGQPGELFLGEYVTGTEDFGHGYSYCVEASASWDMPTSESGPATFELEDASTRWVVETDSPGVARALVGIDDGASFRSGDEITVVVYPSGIAFGSDVTLYADDQQSLTAEAVVATDFSVTFRLPAITAATGVRVLVTSMVESVFTRCEGPTKCTGYADARLDKRIALAP